MLVAIVVGVVLSSVERDHALPAGDFGVTPDAAVAAFFLFKERLGRIQVVGVVMIVIGVTVLAGVSA